MSETKRLPTWLEDVLADFAVGAHASERGGRGQAAGVYWYAHHEILRAFHEAHAQDAALNDTPSDLDLAATLGEACHRIAALEMSLTVLQHRVDVLDGSVEQPAEPVGVGDD